MSIVVSGVDPGERQLNGPQTTGRSYRNLSAPAYATTVDEDAAVPMRDGVALLADIHRPKTPGRYPVLIAASPYPRQIQNLGAPMGFIEAGASDFFVPRGYVHVIANLRGTGGSGGTFSFFDGQERRDMYDLVEWAAEQPWSDGNVGMVGISYFAMTQMEAAVERPPHLKAIMPIAGSFDMYDAVYHHGLLSASFVTPFLSMVGLTSGFTNRLWRSSLVDAVRKVLLTPVIHKRFGRMNGEAAIAGLKLLLKVRHNPHPWDDLWRSVAVEHQLRDAWWDERNLLPMLEKVNVPVYLGCDWQNVPLHLPGTFTALAALVNSPHVRVAMMGEYGLAWPWESLHVEALAWFDHWLKGHDTGILDGPRFRYTVPGADEWRASETWPVEDAKFSSFFLGADGSLEPTERAGASRTMMTLGAGLNRPRASETDPPSILTWTGAPLEHDLEVVGNIELQLDAVITAPDAAWFVFLQDVDEHGTASDVTAGYLRAGLRTVDEEHSTLGAPDISCREFHAVPIGEMVRYRIPLVPNARRLKAGHRLRIIITGDDQSSEVPAVMNFRHASLGANCLSEIKPSSRILLPVVVAIN